MSARPYAVRYAMSLLPAIVAAAGAALLASALAAPLLAALPERGAHAASPVITASAVIVVPILAAALVFRFLAAPLRGSAPARTPLAHVGRAWPLYLALALTGFWLGDAHEAPAFWWAGPLPLAPLLAAVGGIAADLWSVRQAAAPSTAEASQLTGR